MRLFMLLLASGAALVAAHDDPLGETLPGDVTMGEGSVAQAMATGGEGGVGAFVAEAERATPTRLTNLAVEMPHGGNRIFDYAYDAWQRVSDLSLSSVGSVESYEYDAIGNVTEMTRGGVNTWVYDAGPFSEIASRSRGAVLTDQHTWDAAGRMASWDTNRPVVDDFRDYDGAGRLARVALLSERTTSSGTTTTQTAATYAYDVDDQLVLERHTRGPLLQSRTFRLQGYRFESVTGHTIEKLLPMVSLIDGDLRWTLSDYDGHAVGTYDSTGVEESLSVLGVYGLEVGGGPAGSWPIFPKPSLKGVPPTRIERATCRLGIGCSIH